MMRKHLATLKRVALLAAWRVRAWMLARHMQTLQAEEQHYINIERNLPRTLNTILQERIHTLDKINTAHEAIRILRGDAPRPANPTLTAKGAS